MLVFDNHHSINTEGKSQAQIIELIFKEQELKDLKAAEDRKKAEEALKANKADVTAPAAAAVKKAELATVPHPTAIGRAIQKVRKTLHI